MDRHERICGWFDTIAEMDGGWEEFDEPVRRALAEIEQIPGLPDNFAIPYSQSYFTGCHSQAFFNLRCQIQRIVVSIIIDNNNLQYKLIYNCI